MATTYLYEILKKYIKSRILMVRNSPFELGKYFKPINISINNMDKFEEKEINKEANLCKKHLVRLLRLIN